MGRPGASPRTKETPTAALGEPGDNMRDGALASPCAHDPAVGRSQATTCSARSPTPVIPAIWLVAAFAARLPLRLGPPVARDRGGKRWGLWATAASSGWRVPP